MKKIKILFINPHLDGAGVEKVLINMVNALDPDKYDITVMAYIDRGERRSELAKHIKYKYIRKDNYKFCGITIKGVDRFFKFIMSFLSPRTLHRLFVKDKYDVEVDYWGQEGLKIVLGSGVDVKKYAWIHADISIPSMRASHYPFKGEEEVKNAFLSMNSVVCVSEDSKQSVIDRFALQGESRDKVIVKYNYNLVDKIIAMSKESVTDIVKPSKLLFCTSGRLNPQKGFVRLIDVAKRLKDNGYDFELWILGQGEQKSELESAIKRSDLQDTVKLLGYQSNPYKYVAMSDVFICSSFFEGLSTVVSESIILGVPVVTTCCTGSAEIFRDSEYGVVTGMDDDSLYEGLVKMFSEQTHNHYKAKTIERQSFFDAEIRLKQIEELFN